MSYPKDLDEYTDGELDGHLSYRRGMRAKGVCDYCLRTPDTKPCKLPERHRHPMIAELTSLTNASWNTLRSRFDCATCHQPWHPQPCD